MIVVVLPAGTLRGAAAGRGRTVQDDGGGAGLRTVGAAPLLGHTIDSIPPPGKPAWKACQLQLQILLMIDEVPHES